MLHEEQCENFFRSAQHAIQNHRAGVRGKLQVFSSSLLSLLNVSRAERQQKDLNEAGDFNVFDFIRPDENSLSDIIACLLTPSGPHGQGEAFLREFLACVRITPGCPLGGAKVYREETTTFLLNPLRRIDILVDFGFYGLGIENKPWAVEQLDQVKDYLLQLNRRFGNSWALVYLSGDGSPPFSVRLSKLVAIEKQGHFRLMSYSVDLAFWLHTCQRICRAERVRSFLFDFAGYIKRHFKPEIVDWRKQPNGEHP